MTDALRHDERVSLDLLRRYLRLHGWVSSDQIARTQRSAPLSPEVTVLLQAKEGGARNFELFVLSTDGYDDIEIVVPTTTTGRDYLQQINGVIDTLAAVQQREPNGVISDIRSIGFDRVFSRVPDALVVDDSIHLSIATNYVTDIRELLTATATTELQPAAFYPRARREAVEYADRCRFGHTFRGSFGFTVESPLAENNTPPLPTLEESPPFERKVIQRLARGLAVTCKAVDTGSVDPLVESIPSGFSANACEKFADLVEDTSPGGLTISFSFSPEWKPAPGFTGPVEYRVDARHVEITRSAAKAMREKPVSRPETIHGQVSDLHTDDPWDIMNVNAGRTITVVWSSDDLGDISVNAPLKPEDYIQALDAHRYGKAVKISGTLERKGRSWVLSGITAFSTEGAPG